MGIAEKIYEKAKSLSMPSQEKVLSFMDDLDAQPAPNGSESKSSLDILWADLENIIAEVPESDWGELPIDGAANHDHYLYGAPKR